MPDVTKKNMATFLEPLYDAGRMKGREEVLAMIDPTERPLILACLGPVVPVYVCKTCKDTGSFYDGFEMAPCRCLAGVTGWRKR